MAITIYPNIVTNTETSSDSGSRVVEAKEDDFLIRNSKISSSSPQPGEGQSGDIVYVY
jgi:hypothetical protein